MRQDEGFTGGWLPGLGILVLLGIGAALSWWALPRTTTLPADGPSVASPSEAPEPAVASPRVASPEAVDPAWARPAAAPSDAPSLHTRAAAFLEGELPTVAAGVTGEAEDAARAQAFQVRAAEHATLSEELAASPGSVEDLTDLAAVHLAFAEDLEGSVAPSYLTPEQAVAYTARLAEKAGRLRTLAAAAVDRARMAGVPSPDEERRLDQLSVRLAPRP